MRHIKDVIQEIREKANDVPQLGSFETEEAKDCEDTLKKIVSMIDKIDESDLTEHLLDKIFITANACECIDQDSNSADAVCLCDTLTEIVQLIDDLS